MYNYYFRSEPTDYFYYATKQTYYNGKPDQKPEAVKMGLFATIVNDHKRYLLSQSAPSQLR